MTSAPITEQSEVDVADDLVDVASITDGKAIVRFSKTEAALAELRSKYKDARYDLTTVRGDTAARLARRELVSLRTGLEKRRKELKLPAVEFSHKIDSEAKRIAGEIVALEEPIDEQIKLDEQRRENDRLAKLRAEEERVFALRERVGAIGAVAIRAAGLPSAEIQKKIELVSRLDISPDFEEFVPEAINVKATTLAHLRELHAAALVSEAAAAEALRNKERLAELERAEAIRVAHEAKERREREAREEQARAVERKAAELRQRQSQTANELIAEIRVILHRGFTSSAAGLLELATLVEAISIDGTLGEFNDAAQKARDDALVQLHEMHLHVLQREAEKRASDIEQQRIRNEQAEAQRRIDEAAAEVARQQEAIAEQQRAVEAAKPGTKTAWVDLDDATELGEFRQSTLSVEEVDSLIQQLADCRAALTDALERLEGWINTKCPKKHVAEHMAHVAKLRAMGGLV